MPVTYTSLELTHEIYTNTVLQIRKPRLREVKRLMKVTQLGVRSPARLGNQVCLPPKSIIRAAISVLCPTGLASASNRVLHGARLWPQFPESQQRGSQ